MPIDISYFTWEDKLGEMCGVRNYCGIPTFEFRTDEDPHKAININGKTITPATDPSTPCSGDCWTGHDRSWKINM